MATAIALKDKSTSGQRAIASDTLTGTRKTLRDTVYVLTDSINEDTDDVLSATGLPLLGDLKDNGYVVLKTAREVDAVAGLWEVDVHYDSQIDPTRPRFVEYAWSSEKIDEVFERDPVDGRRIVNAVGEPLIVTRPVSIAVYNFSRIQTFFSSSTIFFYENRVNAFPFFGFPTDSILMDEIRDESIEIGGSVFRKVHYVLKINLKYDFDLGYIGWNMPLLEHGTKYKDENGNFVVFEDKNGTPITGNLNYDGTKRDPELSGLYSLFHRYPRVDFSPLGIS